MSRCFNLGSLYRLLLSLIFSSVALSYADSPTVDDIVAEGLERTRENQSAQKHVDGIHSDTLELIKEYEDTLNVVEGLRVYNGMMGRQVARQEQDMVNLRQSINDVSVIERQILPLLTRMLDGLSEFVNLDLPFQLDERKQRVENLRGIIERADVTVAEKARRVFEAFQIETEFGRTIETYRSKLKLEEGTYDVDFIRIGRIALLYRAVGNGKAGYWNTESHTWVPVKSSSFQRYFETAMKVSRREMAPELITIPIALSSEKI